MIIVVFFPFRVYRLNVLESNIKCTCIANKVSIYVPHENAP